jgi:hypothetical protein
MLERELQIIADIKEEFAKAGVDWDTITVEGNTVKVTGKPSGEWVTIRVSPGGQVTRVTAHR